MFDLYVVKFRRVAIAKVACFLYLTDGILFFGLCLGWIDFIKKVDEKFIFFNWLVVYDVKFFFVYVIIFWRFDRRCSEFL